MSIPNKAKTQVRGFFDFIRQQGVVGLAIGFLLGGAVSDLVGSFVKDVVEPLIGIFFFFNDGIAEATVRFFGAEIGYGRFLTFCIDFIIIAAVVYFIFKGLRLDKIDVKKSPLSQSSSQKS